MKDLLLIASELQTEFWERDLLPTKEFVCTKYNLDDSEYDELLEIANYRG